MWQLSRIAQAADIPEISEDSLHSNPKMYISLGSNTTIALDSSPLHKPSVNFSFSQGVSQMSAQTITNIVFGTLNLCVAIATLYLKIRQIRKGSRSRRLRLVSCANKTQQNPRILRVRSSMLFTSNTGRPALPRPQLWWPRQLLHVTICL